MKKLFWRKLFCLLLCGALLLAAYPASANFFEPTADSAETAAAEAGFRYEGPGFDTPEDAVLYYLAGLKNLDIDQTLGAFAWETQAAHYSFRDQIIRAKGMDPVMVPGMPFSDDFSTAANVECMRNLVINGIYTALEIYMLGENHWTSSLTGTISISEEADADAYLELFDPEKLRRLTEMDNVRFYDPDVVTDGKFSMNVASDSPKRQENYQKQIRMYGADEIQYRVAAAEVGDDALVVMPTIARYGDRWYLVSYSGVVSTILGIDMNRQAFFLLEKPLEGMSEERIATILFSASEQTFSLPEAKPEKIRWEGAGFDAPEDVVIAYMEGIKNLDIQQMLGVFAWETQVSAYSLKNQMLRLRSVGSYMPVRMPAMDGSLDIFNIESLRREQSRRIYQAIRSYIAEGPFLDGYRLTLATEEETDDFIQKFETAQLTRIPKLSQMSSVTVISPETVVPKMATPAVQTQMEQYRGGYGADELRELAGIATIGDEMLACDLIIARYGDRWYAVSTGGIAFSLLGVTVESQAFVSTQGGLPGQ